MTFCCRFSFLTLLAVALPITCGCQHPVASKLSGRWDMLPPEALQGDAGGEQDQQATDNASDLYDSVAGGESAGTMSLVFHRNGKLETFTDFPMASTGRPKVGTWSILSWDEPGRIATLKCTLLDEVTETRVTFIDDDTIQLIPPNIAVLEMELRFRRHQPP
jgi:hypothetical protein